MPTEVFAVFLCLLSSMPHCLSTVCTVVDGYTDTALYHQYCCVENNKGKSFILTNNDKNQYLLCPHYKIPNLCSSIDFLSSCSAILSNYPAVSSGYYNIKDGNGTVVTVYCDMEGVNCGGEGGWTRLAYLDMSENNPCKKCPPGFRLYEENGVRGCGRQSTGCESIKYSAHNISYSKVCGRVNGYQKGSTDAVQSDVLNARNDINGAYVDGVSLTRGNPRQHIWTFMAGLQENTDFLDGKYMCPCSPVSGNTQPQSFVGNDYFCESGEPRSIWDRFTFHSNDTLWDGQQCGSFEQACCNDHPSLPWFTKDLQESTTDYIELRVCADYDVSDEDVAVYYYEIFVK